MWMRTAQHTKNKHSQLNQNGTMSFNAITFKGEHVFE